MKNFLFPELTLQSFLDQTNEKKIMGYLYWDSADESLTSNVLSWSKKNKSKHGILMVPINYYVYPYEIFFSSRLDMYLNLLNCLHLSDNWVDSLPKVEREVTMPTSDLECPICIDRYLKTPEETSTDEEPREMPLRLSCRHILGAACISRLARQANASSCVVCPLCRASYDHILTPDFTREKEAKSMWIAIEIFSRLRGQEKFQDIEAIQYWARDDVKLRNDVPEQKKRKAIKYAVEWWDELGDEKMLRRLADRVCGKLTQCTSPPAQRYFLSPSEFDYITSAEFAICFRAWLVIGFFLSLLC